MRTPRDGTPVGIRPRHARGRLEVDAAWAGLLGAGRGGWRGPLGLTPSGEPVVPGDRGASVGELATVDAQGAVTGPMTPEAAQLLALLAPVALAPPDQPFVVAQLAQSLDGYIATEDGASRSLSGAANLDHLHRLRALVDVVVVGRRTATRDDPRLTVRRVDGPHPARAVLDPSGRVAASARLFAADGARCLRLGAGTGPAHVEHVRVSRDPQDVRSALARAGLRRILVEGGGETVSAFVEAGAVDRLHLAVAPFFFGAGRRGLALPAARSVAGAHRPRLRRFAMDPDVLYECAFAAGATRTS
ncbi:MAG: dihydrofolate reductase family protein [Myxococcota bacterium]